MHLVFMLWLTLLLAVREVESLDFCFNASLEGSRLNSTILKKVDVSSMMECVVSCVQEPCCRSLNYRKRLPQDLASLCEMLHDVVYNTSAELEKNSSYDYIYFNAPRKEYNSSCVKDTTHEFDLEFPSKNKEIILLHNNVLTKISNMTLMFWINTLTAGKMAVLSYAVEESARELRVFVQGDKIMLVFQSKLSESIKHDFISTPGVNMTLISQSCSNPVGNIINWSAVQDLVRGNVVKEQPRSCKPLRNNPEYDIIISPSTEDIHIESSKSLHAFTITLWGKDRYGISIKYSAGTSLSFYIDKDVFNLEIADASETHMPLNSTARVPTYQDEYWHHIATTWSNETGHWKIYLDGSLVSIMHNVVSGITIPAGGKLSLASGLVLSRLNIWNYEIDGHALSLMAIKGPLFENGNVFAWYGVKQYLDKHFQDFQITPSDLYNSRSRSVYQMNFPEASTTNYAKIENVFPDDIEEFTACFWAKILKTDCAIFTYSTSGYNYYDEIAAYFYANHGLDLIIKGENSDTGPLISAFNSWHFYCMQWSNSHGLVQTYQDAIELENQYGEIRYRAAGHVIPSNGAMVLGQELDAYASGFDPNQAFKGSLAGLNFWTYILHINTIQGMAAGMINVNGNLLQWRDFMTDHVFGDVSIVERSEAEIPEYRVQALRDQWCKNNITAAFTYARFARNQGTGYMWICVTPTAMLKENMCYNISKGSKEYYTMDKSHEILGIN